MRRALAGLACFALLAGCAAIGADEAGTEPALALDARLWDLPGARVVQGPGNALALDAPYAIDARCFVLEGAGECAPTAAGWEVRNATGSGARVLIVPASPLDGGRVRLARTIDGGEVLLLLRDPSPARAVEVGHAPLRFDAYRVEGGIVAPASNFSYRVRTFMPLHGHAGYGNAAPRLVENASYAGTFHAVMPGRWEVRLFEKTLGATATWTFHAHKPGVAAPDELDLGGHLARLEPAPDGLRLRLAEAPSSVRGAEVTQDIAQGASFAMTFDASWTGLALDYHCHPHPEMTGTVRVEGAPAEAGAVVRVAIRDHAFDPAWLVVAPGTSVVWENVDPVAHNVHAADPREELDGPPVEGAALWVAVEDERIPFRDQGSGQYLAAWTEALPTDSLLVGFVGSTPVEANLSPTIHPQAT